MKDKEYYSVSEIKETKEFQEFPAQEYYVDKGNKNVNEKYDTFEDATDSRKRLDYFDLHRERKKKSSVAKKVVKKILSLPVSVGSGVVAVIAGAIIAITIASGVTDLIPNVSVNINDVGTDYVSCEMNVDELNSDIDYIMRVSNVNQTIDNYDVSVGINNYLVTGLNPNETYTISLIGYSPVYKNSYTYYSYDFYTLTEGEEAVEFLINENYDNENLSIGIDYNIGILNKAKDSNFSLIIEGIEEHYEEGNREITELTNNSFIGYIPDLSNSFIRFIVLRNGEEFDSYEYEINHNFGEVHYEVIYDDSTKQANFEYSAKFPSDKYNYYMYLSGNEYYNIEFEGKEKEGVIENLDNGTYYLYIYAYLKEEYMEPYVEGEEEYNHHNYEKFLYSADVIVSKPVDWEEENNNQMSFDLSYDFPEQFVNFEFTETSGNFDSDSNYLLYITQVSTSGEESYDTVDISFEQVDDNYLGSYRYRYNYSTEYMNIELYQSKGNESIKVYEEAQIFIDDFYKDANASITFLNDSVRYYDDYIVIPYEKYTGIGDYTFTINVFGDGEELDYTDSDSEIRIDKADYYNLNTIEFEYYISGLFGDGYHDYDNTIYAIDIAKVDLSVDVTYNEGTSAYTLVYRISPNNSNITINSLYFMASYENEESEEFNIADIVIGEEQEIALQAKKYSKIVTVNSHCDMVINIGNEYQMTYNFDLFEKNFDELPYDFNLDYEVKNQIIEITVLENSGYLTSNDQMTLTITEFDNDGNQNSEELELSMETNNEISSALTEFRYRYTTNTITLELFKDSESVYKIENIDILDSYKESEANISFDIDNLIFSDNGATIPYTVFDTTGTYQYEYSVILGTEVVDFENGEDTLIVSSADIWNYEALQVSYIPSGLFGDGYHEYDSVNETIDIPKVSLDIDIEFEKVDTERYKVSYLVSTNTDKITINSLSIDFEVQDKHQEYTFNNITPNVSGYDYIDDFYYDEITITPTVNYVITYGNSYETSKTFDPLNKAIDPIMRLDGYHFESVESNPAIVLEFTNIGGGGIIVSINDASSPVNDPRHMANIDLTVANTINIQYYNSNNELVNEEAINVEPFEVPNYGFGEGMQLITYNNDGTINFYMNIEQYEYTDVDVEFKLISGNDEYILEFNDGKIYKENLPNTDFEVKVYINKIKDGILYMITDGELAVYSPNEIEESVSIEANVTPTTAPNLVIDTWLSFENSATLIIDNVSYDINLSELLLPGSTNEYDLSNYTILENSSIQITMRVASDINLYDLYSEKFTLIGDAYKEYTFDVALNYSI